MHMPHVLSSDLFKYLSFWSFHHLAVPFVGQVYGCPSTNGADLQKAHEIGNWMCHGVSLLLKSSEIRVKIKNVKENVLWRLIVFNVK